MTSAAGGTTPVSRLHHAYVWSPIKTVIWMFVLLAAVRLAGAFTYPLMVAALLGTPLVLLAAPRVTWADIGLRRIRSGTDLLGGVGLVIAAYAVTVGACVALFGTGPDNWASGIAEFFRLGVAAGSPTEPIIDTVALIAALGLAIPLAEEVCYRGVLFAALLPRWGRWPTVLATSAAWSVVHLGDYGLNPVDMSVLAGVLPSVFLMGIALGWCRLWTRSVVGSAVAQGCANLMLVLWVLQW